MSLLKGELNRLRVLTRASVIRRYLAIHPEPKLHLGCGSRLVEGWLNADKFDPRADIYLDVYRRLPFTGNALRAIYMEHLIEHVNTERVQFFLRELHRVLAPGGILRVTCPDLELFARMYCSDDRGFYSALLDRFREQKERAPDKYWLVRTKGGVWNTRAVHRFYHHRWMYDFETLDSCLREVGFSNVMRQEFGRSLLPPEDVLDSETRRVESLYLDAVK